jgi:glycine betaine/choline ABC-type transport system substrate-binding protein
MTFLHASLRRALWGLALGASLLAAGCETRKKPIVVASKTGPEQMLLGEIVAQHLEARLAGVPVERRLALGNTPILYQAITGGEVTIYPESAGVVETLILKETPSPDPAIVLERARREMARVALLDMLEPLGFEDATAVVIRASPDAPESTLSMAAQGKSRWKLGVTSEFEENRSGLPALNSYHLPQAAPMRAMETGELFAALEKGDLNMIVTSITNGRLNAPEWKVLRDDKKVFPSQQVCLLARQDRLNEEPLLRQALGELSGKLTLDVVRKLNQQVDVDHLNPATVASQFLASAGLR